MQAVLSHTTVAIIKPQDNLNAVNALEFERDLTTALRHENNQILLVNLEKVELLDSSGLMSLVSALKLAQNLGKRLGLCCVSPSIKIIFELTQLDRVFEIFENQKILFSA
ncbi:STAS domain-containing protein [Mastigocoleus testarum]|uniref:Anti-sigma factor antagonist n=1 Tax=Mastigocoleus testarum BC008 TaxID=371196 RepID=A0A0V7ZD89_9CYAN|nr:STAS domain-containing protein [Mastigocoleus testarum]KST62528.1 anti-anti-sigma factor [Mastigocoleus testarum BC008]KST69148.1 anti-anti-sigma factor [Mastigocoleus testarum BC008]